MPSTCLADFVVCSAALSGLLEELYLADELKRREANEGIHITYNHRNSTFPVDFAFLT